MHVGSLGEITFEASINDVFTIRSMDLKRSINFGEHAVMEGVPRLQHTGRKLDAMTLPIVMDSMLPGAVPCEQRITSLRELAATGEEQPLTFGQTYYGLWVLKDVNVTARVMHGDRIFRADVTLELSEYN